MIYFKKISTDCGGILTGSIHANQSLLKWNWLPPTVLLAKLPGIKTFFYIFFLFFYIRLSLYR